MQLSGNKVRKLEFLIADAKAQGADCVITIGGIQSNHCRATAVAAKYFNLDCYLILRTSRVSSSICHLHKWRHSYICCPPWPQQMCEWQLYMELVVLLPWNCWFYWDVWYALFSWHNLLLSHCEPSFSCPIFHASESEGFVLKSLCRIADGCRTGSRIGRKFAGWADGWGSCVIGVEGRICSAW